MEAQDGTMASLGWHPDCEVPRWLLNKTVRAYFEKLRQFVSGILTDGPMSRQNLIHIRLATQDWHEVDLPQTSFVHQILQCAGGRPFRVGVNFVFVLHD